MSSAQYDGPMPAEADVNIPNRFESLQETFGQEIRPLILPIDHDLRALNALRDRARVQRGGLLCFILGQTGIGKTTAIHSTTVHMPDDFAPVLRIPPEVPFRDVSTWLGTNLPAADTAKSTPVLFDGREVSDDSVGVKQLLSSLNQLLRARPDLLFCWPTTDTAWHRNLRTIADTVGGANMAPPESDVTIAGPPSAEWPTVLDRLLLQFGKSYEDVGIAREFIASASARAPTIGDFLTLIGKTIAERLTKTRVIKRLPQIVFVITSSGDVVGEANRIRRGTQALNAEPLLRHSPRSEAGKWWTERNKSPDHHLGYIISLFDARLVTMTASAVVHSCLHYSDTTLVKAAAEQGARADKGNAKRIIEASELYRFLKGEPIPEFTSGKKGGHRDSTARAYSVIQGMSTKRHKVINQALCALVRSHLADLSYSDSDFEVSHGGNVITDAVVTHASRPYSLEFHHLSEGQCVASGMSSYIM